MLPKIDNTKLEQNQTIIIQKIDGLNAVLTEKLLPVVKQMAEASPVEKMFPFVVQIADNLYNLASKMDAQVTSLKEVRDALAAQNTNAAPNEGQRIEAEREANRRVAPERRQEKKKSALDRILDYFEKVLLPLVIGFVFGLSKALGGFESTFGKIATVFAALLVALSGFRKAVFKIVSELIKAFPGIAKSVADAFKSLVAGLKSIGGKLVTNIINAFNSIVSGLKSIGPKIVKATINTFREIVLLSANVFEKITSAASKFGQFVGKIGQMFSKIGRLLGPIGVVISTVMALFQGIKGAFKGFDEEGIYGAIKGFTSGLISGLIGWIGDLGSWLLGKLISLLGFEELGDKIASFDFTGFLNTSIQTMFDTIKNSLTSFIGMTVDAITGSFNRLGDSLKEIFDIDIGQTAKKLLVSMFPPNTMIGKAVGTGEIQEDIVAAEAKKADEKARDNAARAEQKVAPAGAPAAQGQAVRTIPSTPTARGTVTAVPVATTTAGPGTAARAQAPVVVTSQGARVVAPAPAAQPQPAITMRPTQTRVPGEVINAQSQAITAAQTRVGGSGGLTNIVAPSNQVVNAPSSQVINSPLTAYGIFGGRFSLSPTFMMPTF